MYRLERSGTPFRTEPFRCTVFEDKLSLSYYTSGGMDSKSQSHTTCHTPAACALRSHTGAAAGAGAAAAADIHPGLRSFEERGRCAGRELFPCWCGPSGCTPDQSSVISVRAARAASIPRVDDCYGRGPTGARHNRAAFLTFGSVRSACRHVPVSVSGLASGHTFHGPLRPPFPTCRWLEQGNLVYPGDPEKASAAASSGYWLGPFFSSVPRFRHWGFSWPIARPGAGHGRGGPSSRQDVRAQPDSGQCPCATFDDLCEEKGHPAARAAHGCCDEGR